MILPAVVAASGAGGNQDPWAGIGDLLKRFLGESSPAPVEFTHAPPTWALLVVAVPAALALVAWAYGRGARSAPRAARLGGAGLRLAAVAVLAVVLAGPALRHEEKRSERSSVVVLIDDSLSMSHRDDLQYTDDRDYVRAAGALATARDARLSARLRSLPGGGPDLARWEALKTKRDALDAATRALAAAYDAALQDGGAASDAAKAAEARWRAAAGEAASLDTEREALLRECSPPDPSAGGPGMKVAAAGSASDPAAPLSSGAASGAPAPDPLSPGEIESLVLNLIETRAGPRRIDLAAELLGGSGLTPLEPRPAARHAGPATPGEENSGGAAWSPSPAAIPRLQAAGHDVVVYRFSDLVESGGRAPRLLEPLAPDRVDTVAPRGYRTRIGDAFAALGRELRGRNVAGVLVATDGRNTAGEPDLRAAVDRFRREAGTEPSVHVRALGQPDRRADTEMFSVTGTTQVMKKDAVILDLLVRSTPEFAGCEARLAVTRARQPVPIKGFSTGDQVREDAVMTLSGDPGAFQRAQIILEPDRVGEITYEIALAPQEGEKRVDNNAQRFTLTVTDRKLAALYVEGWPRVEWRHLVNALTRDPSIHFNGFLISAEPGWPQPVSLVEGEVQRLTALPRTREEWNRFDVVIWGDLPPSTFTDDDYAALEKWVSEDGGGLVLIAGRQFMPDAYVNREFQAMLPVSYRLDLREAPTPDREKRYRVTPAGRQSPLLQISDQQADPADLFKERTADHRERLGGYYWLKRAREWKPGATVLAAEPGAPSESPAGAGAEGGAGRSARGVIGWAAYGRGAVLFHATDETWRWRRLHGDKYFYRYWQNAIRFVSTERFAGRQQGYELRLDGRAIPLGDAVKVYARVTAPEHQRLARSTGGGEGAAESELTVGFRLERPGAPEATAVTRRAGAGERFFSGLVRPKNPGRYSVWIDGLEASRQAPVIFEVTLPNEEFREIAPDPAAFAALATVRRGVARASAPPAADLRNVYTPATLHELDIPAAARDLDARVSYRELWDHPRLFLLFIGLLAAEWTLRRLSRLV
ncbi:MAG: hypothetical protein HY719_12130 [Planctomycetes bacterium]|nr:hypothetical protein [Planctomycetota bacterium]